jgi:hypothetical protein
MEIPIRCYMMSMCSFIHRLILLWAIFYSCEWFESCACEPSLPWSYLKTDEQTRHLEHVDCTEGLWHLLQVVWQSENSPDVQIKYISDQSESRTIGSWYNSLCLQKLLVNYSQLWTILISRTWGSCHLHASFLLGLIFNPEDGGKIFLRNVGWLAVDYTGLYPRRQRSSYFNNTIKSLPSQEHSLYVTRKGITCHQPNQVVNLNCYGWSCYFYFANL